MLAGLEFYEKLTAYAEKEKKEAEPLLMRSRQTEH